MSPIWGSKPRRTDRLVVGRNVTLKSWEELIAYFPWYDTGHIEKDASNHSSIAAFVLVTAVTFPQSRCLATIGGYTDTHTHAYTQTAT
jgi:hypothetical protein